MSCAVAILNYNGAKHLQTYLPSVLEHSETCEVYVIDNGSTDGSLELLEQEFPQVRIVRLPTNYGFAGGYNLGLREIEASYYILLNSDVEVTKGWTDPLIRYLDEHPECAACQPKILSYANKEYFEHAGAAGGFLDRFGFPYCRGRLFNEVEKDLGQYDETIEVDWTSGACMIIRREVYEEMGGFDNDFFAHMEEIDLCWRIRSKGWRLACNPQSHVYHLGAGTLSHQSSRKTYLNFRNGLFMLSKNLPTGTLLWKIPFRMSLDGLAAFHFLFTLGAGHFLAVLKAHFSFYFHLLTNLQKRALTLNCRGIFLVWDFYLRKKKKYSDFQ